MKCDVCKDREAIVKDSFGLKCPQCWLEMNAKGNNQQLDKPLSKVYAKKSIKPT